jgi:hypothetical protein
MLDCAEMINRNGQKIQAEVGEHKCQPIIRSLAHEAKVKVKILFHQNIPSFQLRNAMVKNLLYQPANRRRSTPKIVITFAKQAKSCVCVRVYIHTHTYTYT